MNNKNKYLMLRSCVYRNGKLQSPSGIPFEWEGQDEIICDDFEIIPKYSNGIFGFLYGEGDHWNFIFGGIRNLLFLVCEVDESDLVMLKRQIKCRKCKIVYRGDMIGALYKLKETISYITVFKLVYLGILLEMLDNKFVKERYVELFGRFDLPISKLDFFLEYSKKFDNKEDAVFDFVKRDNKFTTLVYRKYIFELLNEGNENSYKRLLQIAFTSIYYYGFHPNNFNHTEESFIHHSTLHGVNHTYRVMLNCLLLSTIVECNFYDAKSAFIASYLHDLGRTHDGYCTNHGQYCIDQKLDKYEFLYRQYDIMYPFQESIKTAIIFHCKPDIGAPDEEVLHLLKDADALDRCRLGDLNKRFLRRKETEYLIQFAEWLYRKSPTEILPLEKFVENVLS